MKYYIDYGTGAGNELIIMSTLEEAMDYVEEDVCYTGKSVYIYEYGHFEYPIAILPFYGVRASDSDIVTISFGDFGFYGEWQTDV